MSPMERQLFFKTAHAHLNSGCPALALQVLMELPATDVAEPATDLAIPMEPIAEAVKVVEAVVTDDMIATGTLGDFEFGQTPSQGSRVNGNTADDFDWSKPVSSKLTSESAEDFDWSKPVSTEGGRSHVFYSDH